MAKKGQKFKKYSAELKQEVIRLYLEEHLPKRTIASLLGIDEGRVRLWIKNYLTHGSVELKKGRPKKEAHELELERLRAENAYLKLLIAYSPHEGFGGKLGE
ncbi:MAG: transposase [Fervidobacterium gondwanense]